MERENEAVMRTILLLFSVFLFISCTILENPRSSEVQLKINHYPQTAVGESLELVMLVQEEEEIGGDTWNYFYEDIEGFTYELGYVYDLVVSKKERQNPPQDASAYTYELIRVNAREKAGAEELFEIVLQYGGGAEVFVTGDHLAGYQILEELTINCGALCGDLEEALSSEDRVIGVFRHQGPKELELIDLR